jgi:glycosyltransferase involved in cell wall biosynthesis
VQSKSLLPRLADLECVDEIAIFAWFGVQGGMTQFGPFMVYPGHAHPYGTDVIGHHAKHFGADVVITLIDAWTQKGVGGLVAPAKWLPWMPVDAPLTKLTLDALDDATLPVVYSKYGMQEMEKAGRVAAYVPHGIETDVFRIRDDGKQAKAALAGEDCTHLAVMVAANKGAGDRKAFAVQLRAWSRFAAQKPHARLYVHTDPTTQASGLDLLALVDDLGITERVIFPDRYQYYLGYPAEYMAAVYNAADVLLGASMTEGFGIPLVEAQACGTPVIATKYASMPELVKYGMLADVVDMVRSPYDTWWAMPDIDDVTYALHAFDSLNADQKMERGQEASAAMHEAYAWETVVERYWKPVLEAL